MGRSEWSVNVLSICMLTLMLNVDVDVCMFISVYIVIVAVVLVFLHFMYAFNATLFDCVAYYLLQKPLKVYSHHGK